MQLLNTPLIKDANLEGYYQMEVLTTDSSSKARTLTNNNTVSSDIAGRYGSCASVTSGANKSLSVANTMGIDGNACTFAFWLKLNAEIASSEWVLFEQENTSTKTRFSVAYEYNSGTQRLRFRRTRSGTSNTDTFYTITLGTTLWYHVVLTYDTTNINGYVNGALVAGPTAASGNGGSTNSNIFVIMNDTGSATGGTVKEDDFGVFSRVLTLSEINTLYRDSGAAFLTNFI